LLRRLPLAMLAPMNIRTLLATLIAALALTGAHAAACPPPPPGPPPEVGESAESHAARQAAFRAEQDAQHAAWLHARQQRMWDEADSVIIARIVRVSADRIDYWGDTQRVSLRPVRTIKGRRYSNRFELRYTDATSCGPMPAFDAIQGQVGDEFVIFIQGGRPSQRTVHQTAAITAITDTRIAEAISAD
jgi:hypothetical protein